MAESASNLSFFVKLGTGITAWSGLFVCTLRGIFISRKEVGDMIKALNEKIDDVNHKQDKQEKYLLVVISKMGIRKEDIPELE